MKKIILSLFVGFLGIISFCSAGSYTYSGIANENNPLPILFVPQTAFDTNISLSCVFTPLGYCEGDGFPVQFKYQFLYYYGNNHKTNLSTSTDYYQMFCNGNAISLTYDFSTFTSAGPYAGYKGVSLIQFPNFYAIPNFDISYNCTFQGNYILDSTQSGGGSCDYSGYVLESDINNLYCEEHGYCPIIDTGEELSGMSTLFINEIEHQSAPLINITIPEEYNWNSSVDIGEFNLVISGTNVDHEYIDNIIRTQNSKPSSEDLTNIVSGLIPLFIPGLCIILLLYFIYLFIKKIF